ncbi:MAG: glycine--tRNA ligase [Firmicutes bacterium]|nr:glycine--tRNA ligase [Bacillota bacterium]
MTEKTMDQLVALSKSRGFVYPGSEIYGGLANTWDYGPLGVELKNNIKNAWWKKFIQESPYNVGLDSAILMNPQTWVVSGHVGSFSDPLIDCRQCKARFRADKLIEEHMTKVNQDQVVDGWSEDQMSGYIQDKGLACPRCGGRDFTDIRQFNLMFKTFQGVTEDAKSEIYLRPETAQGIFVNFRNVLRTSRKKIPFGIGQIGKSFRNEITPGNFIFRTREFEQMELEFFCEPGTDMEWYEYWKEFCLDWLLDLGIDSDNLRMRDHTLEELSHYSKATTDIEYRYPFGWGELWGIANRTDYDLRQHSEATGEDLSYLDPFTNEKYTPYCVEPSVGVDRLFLMFFADAFQEEKLEGGDTRNVLRLHPYLAPFKAAVLPLSKRLVPEAEKVYELLRPHFLVGYDDAGSIGRRYRRQDEIGTPFCITFDFDSLEDKAVTIRDRDTMEQIRLPIAELVEYLGDKLVY